jgi:hypothetical protein
MMDDFDRVRMQRYVADNVTPRDRATRRDEVMAQLYATPFDTEPKDAPQEDDTIREADLLRDETFAEYARDLHKLYEGEPFQGTQREAAQYGLDIMGEFYFNFAGPGIGDNPGTLMQAGVLLASGTADNAKQFLYMLDQYERLPNWTGSGLARAFDGIFSDPSTYAGLASLGTGFVARKMAASTARAGIRLQLKNVAQKAMSSEGAVGAFTRTTAQYPAAITGGVTAAQGSISDIAEQAIESEAGYEMDIEDRIKRNLIVTGISGAAGYGLAKGAGVVGRGISDEGEVM